MRPVFFDLKPQPIHTPEELSLVHHIPPGVTSGTPKHLWDLRKLQGTKVEEVTESLMLEPEDL